MRQILFCPDYLNKPNCEMFNEGDGSTETVYHVRLKKKLESMGFDVATIDKGDIDAAYRIVFCEIPRGEKNRKLLNECLQKGYQHKMIFWLLEMPHVRPEQWHPEVFNCFSKVLLWEDALVDNKKTFKWTLPPLPIRKDLVRYVNFQNKKLCTMLNGNKMYEHQVNGHSVSLYSARVEAVRFFERTCPYQFDFYGSGWNKPRTQIQAIKPYLVPHFPSYRGFVDNQEEVWPNYKFAVCYENMISGPEFGRFGCIDKIFYPMMCGCVPIYLGVSNITEYVPEGCFIDRRKFATYDELYAFLLQVTESDYDKYMQCIDDYFKSELFHKNFSINVMVDVVSHHIIC